MVNEELKDFVLGLPDEEMRRTYCHSIGCVYIGDGLMVEKDTYNKVILTHEKIKYGEDLDKKEDMK